MEMAVVEPLINNAISVLATKASLLCGVPDAIDDLKRELTNMQSFLIDADKKGASTAREETWKTDVRNSAYDIEDVIEMFMYHLNSQQIGGQFAWFLHHTIYIPQTLWVRHKIARKLQKINKTIKITLEMNQKYPVNRIEGNSSEDSQKQVVRRGELSFFVEEDELVGIENKRQHLLMWLMDGEPQQTVISIVGMGGSGKTTLAANTYNKAVNTYNTDAEKRHFDCYAWINVSQACDVDDLLRSMIKEFYESRKETNPSDMSSMKYKPLVKTLVSYLEKKTYLLVIDDVWDTDILDDIKVALRDSYVKSRIILTTRNEDVAAYPFGGKSYVHHIQLLQEEEALELFCKKAFSSSSTKSCSSELEPLAQELVGKCEGLPIAIASLGSLMCSKNPYQWKEIYNSLNLSLSSKLEKVESILLLSFYDLSYQLKNCFLYCSLFPEDYMIRRKRLIKLWMAEGFVEQVKESSIPEEVANNYLEELIFRSMLQVVRKNEFGRAKACKMHDLMRDIALSVSKRKMFGAVHGGEAMKECKARRMSIHKTDVELKSFMGMSKLRSFLVFNKCKTFPSRSKMLRVLDLQDAPIDELPNEIVNFFNLKYLNLRRTLLKKLPNSIVRLINLQTLDIRNTQIEVLPRGIGNLQNLRHLIMYRYTQNWSDFRYVNGTQVPSDISRLTNLQSVSAIEAKSDLIQQMRSMTQLTRIGISNVKAINEMELCDSIQSMKLLHYLFIMATNEEETLRMDALSAPPPNLRLLILVGKLDKVPRWFCSLQRLTRLYLHWSRLEEDLLPHIAALPYLGRLTLLNAYVGKQLCFSTGFPKLIELKIFNFPQLNEIIIVKEVMPNIKSLEITRCMQLKTMPKGIEYLENLQELFLRNISMELRNRLMGEDSVDFPKVQHIPNKSIW